MGGQIGEPYGKGSLTEGDIRLLLLEPGQLDQPVRCTISAGRAADWANRYVALSYTWGSNNDMQEIICNESSIEVTRNLFDALHSFRQIDNPIRLWVDALCINQDNYEERGRMVKTMTQIYRNALFVMVWLGNSTTSTSLAVNLIKNLATNGPRLNLNDIMKRSIPWSELEAVGLPSPLDSQWEALDHFMSHLWFRRVWTIQEVSVAKNTVVACGPYMIDWETLFIATLITEAICFNGQRKPFDRMGYKRVFRVEDYRRALTAPKDDGLSLLRLLWNERAAQATDNRDKVFALLGLASDINPQSLDIISPDYTIKTTEVYIKTAQWIASKTENLDFLGMAGILPRPSQYLLPSWVPDWSFPLMTCPLNQLGIGPAYPTYINRRKGLSFANGGSSLILQGIFVDKVLISGHIHRGSPEDERAPPEVALEAWLIMSWCFFEKKASFHEYPASDCRHWIDAFNRTILGNRWIDGKVLHSEHDNDYRDWIELMLYRARYGAGQRFDHLPPVLPQRTDTLLLNKFNQICYGRRLFITEGGYIGIGTESLMEGDAVCIMDRAQVPLVLRPKQCFIGDGQHFPFTISKKWEFVGEAYVHGIMKGEGYREDRIEEFIIS